jgi:hypothetical protein
MRNSAEFADIAFSGMELLPPGVVLASETTTRRIGLAHRSLRSCGKAPVSWTAMLAYYFSRLFTWVPVTITCGRHPEQPQAGRKPSLVEQPSPCVDRTSKAVRQNAWTLG